MRGEKQPTGLALAVDGPPALKSPPGSQAVHSAGKFCPHRGWGSGSGEHPGKYFQIADAV
jgi:hypothetical protein